MTTYTRFIFRVCLLFVVGLGLTACIVTTYAGRDDFSQMGGDLISTLIKDAASEKKGPHGFAGIDQEQVKRRAREFFFKKKEPEVMLFFNGNGDRCMPSSFQTKEIILKCESSRWWRLMKIQFLSPDSYDPLWETPGVKLVFKFHLTPAQEVIESEIEIINITIKKKIY